jgi:hypothetical protein
MKNLLWALVIAVMLAVTPVSARNFADIQVVPVSRYSYLVSSDMVQQAFMMMRHHYSSHVNGLVADWPRVIVFTDNGNWMGCYGALCSSDTEENMRYYTPEMADNNLVYVNLADLVETFGLYDRKRLNNAIVFVLAHELGHHALTMTGVPLKMQHLLMACNSPDAEIVRTLELDKIWDMEWRCQSLLMGGWL